MATERTVLVRLKANVSDFNRGLAEAAVGVNTLRKEINTTNDRTAWLTQGILALAPAVVPLGAAAVPVFTGIATQMGVAALAAGTLALGFHGIGSALKALNDYQIDPTAEHLKKLNQEMSKIGPEGESFVLFLDSLTPQITALQDAARHGMFPGMEDGLRSLVTLMPEAKQIISEVASGIGQLAAEGGANLSGPKFEEFIHFLETDARPILIQMGHTVGNLADGLAALFVDFAPESRSFSAGMEDASRSFARWAHGLDQTRGFQDFLAYIQESGPKAIAFLDQLGQGLLAIVEAAAPVGNIMLPLFTELLKLITALADTPLGSTLILLGSLASVYGRLVAIGSNIGTGGGPLASNVRAQGAAAKAAIPSWTQLGNAMLHSMHSQQQLDESFSRSLKYGERNAQVAKDARSAVIGFGKAVGPTVGAVGLLAVAMSNLDDKMGLTNTTSLTLAGMMVGGGWGAAIGAGIGLVEDFTHEQHAASDATSRWTGILDQQGHSLTAYRTALSMARSDLASFAQESGASGDFMSHMLKSLSPSGIDTNLHALMGNFGGSQLGQMQSQAQGLAIQFQNAQQTAGLLSQFLGTTKAGQAPTFDQMEASVTRVQPALDKLGLTFQDLDHAMATGNIAMFQQVIDTLKQLDSPAAKVANLATTIAGLGDSEQTAADKATALQAALEELLSPGMDLTAATDAWFHALHHLNEALDSSNHTLRGQSDAAQKNRAAISGLVTDMEARLTAEAKSGASSEKVAGDFRRMRQSIIDQADALGLNRREVEALLRSWHLTPKTIKTVYKAQGIDVALQASAQLRGQFKALPDKVQTYIQTHGIPESMSGIHQLQHDLKLTPAQVQVLVNLKNAAALAGIRATAIALNGLHDKVINITTRHFTGGHTREYADGGYTGPGGKYEPAGIVHKGEVVLNQDIVRRDWSMLKARYGYLPGFADGGYVGATHAMSAATPRVTVTSPDYGPLRVTGTLDTPWGPTAIDGIARAAAREEIDADRDFDRKRGNR